MDKRNIVYAGAALLLAGLFCPILSMPLLGSISLFGNGTNILAILLILLGGGCVALAVMGRLKEVVYPAVATALLVAYAFGRMEFMLAGLRKSMAESLKDNPFAGLAQAPMAAVQIQWGWVVLAAGAAALVYAAVTARRQESVSGFMPADNNARIAAGASVLLLLVTPVLDLVSPQRGLVGAPAMSGADKEDKAAKAAEAAAARETQDYIAKYVQLYDVSSKYHQGFDKPSVGVDFKIKNTGNRTLSEVSVKFVFYDADGKAIAEQTFTPVSEFNTDAALKPNYIWQQDSGLYYSADNVPSEWKEGKVTASVTEVKFAEAKTAP
jgi:hypothetical protein